jgi:hypothetical protein
MKAILLIFLLLASVAGAKPVELNGAWQWVSGSEVRTVIFSEKFYAVTEYSLSEKKFIATYGGTWQAKGNDIVLVEEFNTINLANIGKEVTSPIKSAKGTIVTSFDGKPAITWKQIDAGKPGLLAGAWVITGRRNNGEMSKIVPGARRTMKILSGTRFQWIAYNTETKEFFGTGGGTFLTQNGKYTENIEFFSRDNSRVGNRLEFDFAIDGGTWNHKGLSSKGEPIDETWTRRELIGL